MGLLKYISSRVLGKKSNSEISQTEKQALLRKCYFEVMEQRRVLSADPVVAGITYLEGDDGLDSTPDHFEVTFQGGAETTQLTQFTINGDQDLSGTLSSGDIFFDVDSDVPGTGGSHPFLFDADNSIGITADDISSFSVSDDGLTLTVNVENFEAGDVFAFTIDVDEVESTRNDRIASGVEFEGSLFSAQFVDQNFNFEALPVSATTTLIDGAPQTQSAGVFFDEFDDLFDQGEQLAGTELNLSSDNANNSANRTAGAIDAFELVPQPITISGTVYEDNNLNWVQDSDEDGISDVEVRLQRFNEDTGLFEDVATTTTDENGDYEFGIDLNLQPGRYQLVQIQPDGFLDVGADVGSEGGALADNDSGQENIITDINIPLGGTAATDYDFKEIRPASLSGHVFHDANNDGVFDANEEGIANVLVQVTRTGPKPGSMGDPFADTTPIFVRTDANGFYEVDALPPGTYEILEINDLPDGEVNPLGAFIDGQDSLGNVRGVTVGTVTNDRFSEVVLYAGDEGVEYNFGEILPAQIHGAVYSDNNNDGIFDANEVGISGVTIELFDKEGNLVAETVTDDNGNYWFSDLLPGDYTIRQTQPDGFLDGIDTLGTIDGQTAGEHNINDEFCVHLEAGDEGIEFNFGEVPPAQIHGRVFHDVNDNGAIDVGEEGIGNVTVELLDNDGNVIDSIVTDAEGNYWFTDLLPGHYSVREIQPAEFFDGQDSLGQIDGVTTGEITGNDIFSVHLDAGDIATEFNFGEFVGASISGSVHGDANGDKIFNPEDGDLPLEGVELILLDADGNEVARTTTDANGDYIFGNLQPGTYSVREITPEGFIDGVDSLGTVNGETRGILGDDLLSGIVLTSGEQAVDFDFCEHIPAEIHGTVFHDRNNNGTQESGEEGIEGTRIVLSDTDGNIISETLTDAEGNYYFENLIAGEYYIQEFQPDGFTDGIDTLGTVNGEARGTVEQDAFHVSIQGGETGVEYNFGEILLSQISGNVHIDNNDNRVFDPENGDEPLAGVTLELLDANGEVLATTVTDENGQYTFDNLLPGEYSIREIQPEGFFEGGETVGDGGGVASENLISGIIVESGQTLTQHNFCEVEAAEIHGQVFQDGPAFETEDGLPPDGFRDLRDGTFQASTDTPLAGVRLELFFFIDPTNDSLIPRPVTLGEVQSELYDLGTTDPDTPLFAITDENGEYWFPGLPAGNYIVLETQPDGFFDANDSAGTTTGFSFNSLESATAAPLSLQQFSTTQLLDSIVNIQVEAGGISEQNNFSEVLAVQSVTPDPPPQVPQPIPPTPVPPGNPIPPSPGISGLGGLAGSQPSAFTQFIGTSRGASFQTQAQVQNDPYSWHLSVINGGLPRGAEEGTEESSVWQQAGYISNADWTRYDTDDAIWTFTETRDSDQEIIPISKQIRFGVLGGTPLAGDFDGDGTDEVAIFKDGYWLIDINRNGVWDESDLLARLGDAQDRPVVGDWDGDGKDDIGIYGPMWERDAEAIEREPGLPNPDNAPDTKPKNVPPVDDDATNGARVMKLTSFGKQRTDVVDHVFGIGDGEAVPVTGDWNGNGIRSIGTFQNGIWELDTNGDGRFDYQDATVNFGQPGDIPVVGDFNGDGIEEIAVYRSGSWMIDINGNRELDATDKTFQMGGAADRPVVGDWDGDGVDEPGLYTQDTDIEFD